MAECIVDVLEPISVEQEPPEHALVAACGEKGLAQAVAEQAAVGKPRQRVMKRLILERIRVRLALGDVTHRGDEEVARADVHGADHELEWEQAAVLALAHRFVSSTRW